MNNKEILSAVQPLWKKFVEESANCGLEVEARIYPSDRIVSASFRTPKPSEPVALLFVEVKAHP